MKRLLLLIAAAAVCSPLYADIIQDTYIGGDDHGYGDVIADPGDNRFDVSSMDVNLVGTTLTVTINTNFGAGSGLGSFGAYTQTGNGIGFGDLFLSSTGWHPYGSASTGYIHDKASNGTLWDYGVSLADRWSATSAASMYSLDTSSGNSEDLLTEQFTKNAIFRTGQATAVDTSKATALGNSVDFSNSTGKVTFVLDLAGTALASASSIGLHWNMTCGNDTIEGQYNVSVPAPDSLFVFLLGLGLLGLGMRSRNHRDLTTA